MFIIIEPENEDQRINVRVGMRNDYAFTTDSDQYKNLQGRDG